MTTAVSPTSTIVHLDEQHLISRCMAARLAVGAIQHILFLKNQIPFPVAQLGRLPIPPNSKSFKRRVDLLDAVSALSCHLHSAFSALSSSLALNPLKYPHKSGHAQVHLLILLGPSLFGPRSRVLLTIDGLEVRAWSYETEISAHREGENRCINTEGLNGTRGLGRIPLLLPSTLPPATNVGHGINIANPKETEDYASFDPSKPLDSPPLSDETFTACPREQQALAAAELLLYRSLAMACGENGVTLNAEIEPTQTYVLIRAPRRFHHPSWTPRQNMSPGLDSLLTGSRYHEGSTKKERASVKTDEILIRCDYTKPSTIAVDNPENVDADDLIWWSWDRKIVGFGNV